MLAYFEIENLSVFIAMRKAPVAERVIVKIRKGRDNIQIVLGFCTYRGSGIQILGE